MNGYFSFTNENRILGSFAEYTCNEGYYLQGTSQLQCITILNNMTWSDEPPQCNGKYYNILV